MHDHAKPTFRNINQDHIILHSGTNDLNPERTPSQIAREILNPALSPKSDKNKIPICTSNHVWEGNLGR